MYFTKSQKNALLFIIVIFALVVLYNLLDRILHPVEPYDFSQFEEKFNARRDSIKKLLLEEETSSIFYKEDEKNESPKQIKIININTATVDELTILPRIGPAIGQRIIDYRTVNGRFLKKEDIQNVKGIGPKTYEGFKDLIRIN